MASNDYVTEATGIALAEATKAGLDANALAAATAANAASAAATTASDALGTAQSAASVAGTAVQLSDLPTLVPRMGAGALDYSTALVNFKPSNTHRLRKALAAVRTGGAATIGFIGDSITAGTDQSAYGLVAPVDAYSARFMQAMEAKGWPIAGDGPVFSRNTPGAVSLTDARWTFNGTWTTGVGLNFQTTVNGDYATFTSLRSGTVVDIWHYNNNSAPFTYSIDGASAVTVTPVAGATIGKVTISGLDDTTHTVRLTKASGTTFWPLAVAVRDDTGLSVVNAGLGGATALSWSQSSAYTANTGNYLNIASAAATFVMLGVNDDAAGATYPPATFETNLTNAVNFLLPTSDVILMVSPPTAEHGTGTANKADYDAAILAVGTALDLPVINWQELFVDRTTFVADGYNIDALHPNRPALGEMGAVLASILG